MYSDDGTITLVPKIQDPFSEGPEGEYYEKMSGMILHLRGENFLMNVEKKYIPKKGDIVWIDFDPAAGKEIQKRRPGLVVSRYEFNRKTMFAVICPITSTIKNIPTRYTLPDDIETQGQVVISQLKSLDFTERKLSQIEHLPLKDMAKIDQIIEYIF